VAGLKDWFAGQRRLLAQQREIEQLKQELAALRSQNDSMREGMRRCITCDYRLDFKNRQGHAPVEIATED
jgi:hypothetical protein